MNLLPESNHRDWGAAWQTACGGCAGDAPWRCVWL